MEIDNFNIIRPLLKFNSQDNFYFLQILQRKKDHKEETKVNGSNNNSRLIKAYYIHSLEYFDFIKPEIIEICKIFNARAGINLNRRSYEKTALQCLKKVTDQILNKAHDKAHAAYNSVCGAYNHEIDKKWILDIDYDDDFNPNEYGVMDMLAWFLEKIEPVGPKIIANIPSKNGFHLITSPFNVKTWNDVTKDMPSFKSIEIHKNNPTNLYIP